MSLTQMTPDISGKVKSFWAKPEGKVGMIAAVVAFAVFCWGMAIVPWLIILQNTVYMITTGVILVVTIGLVTNKTFLSLVSNTFRTVMRRLTNLVIPVMPLDILKNNIDKMEENKAEYDEALAGVAGSKKQVEAAIEQNNQAVNLAHKRASEIDKKIANAADDLERNSWTLRLKSQQAEAGRRMESNNRLQKTLAQISKLYGWLTRWQSFWEYRIDDTKLQFQGLKTERETLLRAFKGMKLAQRLIQGDPEQVKLVDATLEYLAQDNADKMGFMEDFTRKSKQFLDIMDIDQGAQAAEAEKLFAELEQKMLSASGGGEKVPMQMGVAKAEVVPVGRQVKVEDVDYLDLK